MIPKWYHLNREKGSLMKLITRDTDYAVRAVCFIAQHDKEIVSASDLVKNLKIPRPFLRKVLQRLNKAKVLISHRGKEGGFLLAKSTNRIFLVDLINIFQGPLQLNECLFKKKICPNRNLCRLKKKIDTIERHVTSKLKEITLADLIG